MNIPSARDLEQTAGQRLEEASYDPRRLCVIHTAVSVGVTVLLSLISILLNRQIVTTGGLAGIGSRTALVSIQSVLQLAASLALPFWEAGFLYCALQLSRGQSAEPKDLTAGLRRWAPLLRLWLLQGLLFFCIAFVAIQVASILSAMMPWGNALMELMTPLMENPSLIESGISDGMMQELLAAAIPVYAVAGAVFLVLAIPLFYRLRMATYLLFDQDQPRALAAMGLSRRIMQGNCLALFKIDLHFWWYYILMILAAAASYLDVILKVSNAALPVGSDWAMLISLGLYSLIQLLIAWFCRSRVATVYACAYEALIP